MASFALIVSNICICRKKNFLNKYNKWKINEEGDKVYVTESIQPGHTHSNSGTEWGVTMIYAPAFIVAPEFTVQSPKK